ncbi:MAG: hydroxyacid dehydrogenase [Bacteroidales bacterium]|nr:hydroxyacid dehydrogenase [Bacteroidales bacterium]
MKIIAIEPIGITPERLIYIQNHYTAHGHTFIFHPERNENPAVIIQRMQDADIAIVSNIPLSESILSQCSHLKCIAVAFTGIDHIDTNYCQTHNIHICNAAGYATQAVSEMTIGLILDVYRHLSEMEVQTRKLKDRNNFLGRELFDKTVGIIGTGAIGRRTALLLKSFGCNVIAWNRSEHIEMTENNILYLPLDELLRQSDIVSLHLPLTPETTHFLSKDKLALMKPQAILINTARGKVVDNEALAEALQEQRISGAGIDVYETEPPLAENHPLLKAPRCILKPHIAYATREAFDKRIDIVLQNIDSFLHLNF